MKHEGLHGFKDLSSFHLPYQFRQIAPADFPMFGIPRPVFDEGRSLDALAFDKSPKSAVERVVAIVAHDEVGVGGDGDLRHIVPGVQGSRNNAAVGVLFVRVGIELIVHIDFLIDDADSVTRLTDYPLDEILAGISWVDKDNDIAPGWVAELQQPDVREGNGDAIEELVDQDAISHHQGLFHGAGGNHERLNYKRPYEHCQSQGDEYRFAVFPDNRLFLFFPDARRQRLFFIHEVFLQGPSEAR